jgi:hypothetical protein
MRVMSISQDHMGVWPLEQQHSYRHMLPTPGTDAHAVVLDSSVYGNDYNTLANQTALLNCACVTAD